MEFNYFDKDASSTIDLKELRKLSTDGGDHVSDDTLANLFEAIDKDKSGYIDWMEYLSMMLHIRYDDKSNFESLCSDPIVLVVHQSKNRPSSPEIWHTQLPKKLALR